MEGRKEKKGQEMKRNILLDIDGCIANFNNGFISYLNQHYNANRDPDKEPHTYIFEEWDLDHIDMEEASESFIVDGGFASLKPYPGAKEFVEELMRLGNVHVVTARIGDFRNRFSPEVKEQIKNDTYRWFEVNGIPTNGDIIFEHKKVDLCLDQGISILIEDKLSTVLDAAKNGIHAVVIDRGWNEHPDRVNVYRAYNYPQVLSVVRKLSE